MSKYTPGPWKVTCYPNGYGVYQIYRARKRQRAKMVGPQMPVDMSYGVMEDGETEANIQLITTAPIMRENLQYIERQIADNNLESLNEDDIISINITVRAAKDICKIMADTC